MDNRNSFLKVFEVQTSSLNISRASACNVSPVPTSQMTTFHYPYRVERDFKKKLYRVSAIKALIPFMRVTPQHIIPSQKALLQNTITLIKFQGMNLEINMNILS